MYGINIIEPPHEDPLNKKFPCKQCGKLFRTRQGLSGHIQFVHSTKQKIEKIDSSYVSSKLSELDMLGEAAGWSKSSIQARKTILLNWLDIQIFCKILDIDLSKQDFKNYLIASLADMYQS